MSDRPIIPNRSERETHLNQVLNNKDDFKALHTAIAHVCNHLEPLRLASSHAAIKLTDNANDQLTVLQKFRDRLGHQLDAGNLNAISTTLIDAAYGYPDDYGTALPFDLWTFAYGVAHGHDGKEDLGDDSQTLLNVSNALFGRNVSKADLVLGTIGRELFGLHPGDAGLLALTHDALPTKGI